MKLTQDSIGKEYQDNYLHILKIVGRVETTDDTYYIAEKYDAAYKSFDVLMYNPNGEVQGLYGVAFNIVKEYTPPRTQQEVAEDLIAIGRGCLFLCKDTGHSQLHKGRDIECILNEAKQVFNIEE